MALYLPCYLVFIINNILKCILHIKNITFIFLFDSYFDFFQTFDNSNFGRNITCYILHIPDSNF